jgi:hypothetical protein
VRVADLEALVDVGGGEELYTVSIKGNGIAVEKSVSAQVARQVINAVMGGAVSESASGPAKHAEAASGTYPEVRRTSLREFIEESQARRNPDKITTIAQYLLEIEGKELFTRDDIRGRFRSAGEAAPANFPRDFAWAVKNSWIAEDTKSPNLFYVTQTGRNAIANRFPSEVKKGTPQPTTRRRLRRTNTMRNAES